MLGDWPIFGGGYAVISHGTTMFSPGLYKVFPMSILILGNKGYTMRWKTASDLWLKKKYIMSSSDQTKYKSCFFTNFAHKYFSVLVVEKEN